MVDQSQLDLLKSGVNEWNEWRRENPKVQIDLSNADLSYANLGGTNLKAANLNNANLGAVNLRGACLAYANLTNVNFKDLVGADLRDAKLNSANLNDSNLSDSDLSYANLYGAYLNGAKLIRANLSNTNLSYTRFLKANLNGAKLTGANLSCANLKGIDLEGANLEGCQLEQVTLEKANLKKASLQKLDLSGAYLKQADLTMANLEGAYLNGAYLTNTNLKKAKLNGASLKGVDLRNANLLLAEALGTNFEGANFTGACIGDWKIDRTTSLNYVICQYVYLAYQNKHRIPTNGQENFALGRFSQFAQKSLVIIDLFFPQDIDWQAFIFSFNHLQAQGKGKELTIKAIESKNNGTLVVKINVPSELDVNKIEAFFWQKYQESCQEAAETYCEQIQVTDIENLKEIEQKETLAEVAVVVKPFLGQLETQGFSLQGAKNKVASELATQANNNPLFKSKLVAWEKYLADAAVNSVIHTEVVEVIQLALGFIV